METDPLVNAYEDNGFELVEIEDRDVLLFEMDDQYALISDDDGNLPLSLDTPVIFSLYDDYDAFQWSVTLESSEELFNLVNSTEDYESLLRTLLDIRSENIERYATSDEMDEI